jgi:D-beta-D-heptose 7-phosphate kinase / D-beta-D-heptose 1-phosphate adenosyltransferase
MFDYETALEDLAHRTVLCVGDLMLDDFVYGEVSRVSPEAPVPVCDAILGTGLSLP